MWISIRKFLLVLPVVLWSPASVPATEDAVEELKNKALTAFKSADYPAAIEFLQQALSKAPDNAEVYYYLGYFTHYLCYDSVPLSGFGRDKSDEVLGYLRRAVELDPGFGNAYYFIGAEYGGRARDQLQGGDAAGAAEQFRMGREEGGYPDWMLEWGRNLLNSCERDAILITGGDADTNPVEFIQVVEGYRTDVTVIPIALLNRPWFVLLLKEGLAGAVRPAPISWSREQIMKMRPYKWKTNMISVPIAEDVRKRYELDQPSFEWELAADECGGEQTGRLDAGRAVLADIVVTNQFERPIYFSTGCSPAVWLGLESYVQLSGVAQHLLPMEVAESVDVAETRAFLLDEEHFEALPTVRQHDMPRASGVLNNYRAAYIRLAFHYLQNGETASAAALLTAMGSNVPEEVLPIPDGLKETVAKLEQRVIKKR